MKQKLEVVRLLIEDNPIAEDASGAGVSRFKTPQLSPEE